MFLIIKKVVSYLWVGNVGEDIQLRDDTCVSRPEYHEKLGQKGKLNTTRKSVLRRCTSWFHIMVPLAQCSKARPRLTN